MTAEIAGWLGVVVLGVLAVIVRARREQPSPGVTVLAEGPSGRVEGLAGGGAMTITAGLVMCFAAGWHGAGLWGDGRRVLGVSVAVLGTVVGALVDVVARLP